MMLIKNIKCFVLPIFLLAVQPTQAQKPAITASAYNKWATLMNPLISGDGNYVIYMTRNHPEGDQTLTIRSTRSEWSRSVTGCSRSHAFISSDSRYVVFTRPIEHELGIIYLTDTGQVRYIASIVSFKHPLRNDNGWLAIQLKDPSGELLLYNVHTGKKLMYSNVRDFIFNDNGTRFVITMKEDQGANTSAKITWINLESGDSSTIWQGVKSTPDNFVFDGGGSQLAFTVKADSDKNEPRSVWYYRSGAEKPTVLLTSLPQDTGVPYHIIGLSGFSGDGQRLMVDMQRDPIVKADPSAAKVDVWSYQDTRLQSAQLEEVDQPVIAKGMIDIAEKKFLRLETFTNGFAARERVIESFFTVPGADNPSIRIIARRDGLITESFWNQNALARYYALSLKTGQKTELIGIEKLASSYILSASPQHKYLVFFNVQRNGYYSYEIATGVIKLITRTVHHPDWYCRIGNDYPKHPDIISNCLAGIAGWAKDDSAVFIYDCYDIWQVNPKGIKPPVNLTNCYGLRNKTVFRFVFDQNYQNYIDNPTVFSFSQQNKENGFAKIQFGKASDPKLISKGPYYYWVPDELYFGGEESFSPVKAAHAQAYLVSRGSEVESPNYFFTEDFKTFKPLSDIHPERSWNWMTTELINYKTLDGKQTQGILFKPENFDPQKKYPLIFYYYETFSDGLHAYRRPGYSSGSMDIATYVSNGYLVFTPDIHYQIGHPGASAYNSVMGAVRNYLAKQTWVDLHRMGLQGHSFGGYETNYIISRTKLFAAACSASGLSDLVSMYGSNNRKNGSDITLCEVSQNRMNAPPWLVPNRYLENSPIFYANRINTPLLLMSDKNDGSVPYVQGIELFTTMRRLGKKTWMLQYDGEGHSLGSDRSTHDFTLRMQQFFDHYLKGAPSPKWMAEGIPAAKKGIDPGYELEPAGIEPGPGLLTPEEQKRLEAIEANKKGTHNNGL